MKYGPAIANYKGLDYSERFVRVANERAMQIAKTSSGPFALGDVRDIKEEDSSWDVVIFQDCLEHTNGYEKPIQEGLRVAKKRIIVTFWHLTDTLTPHINDDGDDGYGAWYDKATWEKYLDTLGYAWFHEEIFPEGKLHSWHFYIIDKEEPK
jgi:ubiquinone/menaquinone biosynthesis C-methylase UbiE